MDTLVLLTLTGLGLGALYFLIASGLALIFGLMDVLNFAHGAFLTVSTPPGAPPERSAGRRGCCSPLSSAPSPGCCWRPWSNWS
ncbi:hypothetical protein [Streptomyces pseudogriseolus]|uniref:hypothetical protein n=1 Tax=Streptomyces pseudogriseolus TaxID=36817 RepID=UPI003FA2CC84